MHLINKKYNFCFVYKILIKKYIFYENTKTNFNKKKKKHFFK